MFASLLLLAVLSPPLEVRTTFYPTTYFASRIGGDLVHVTCPLPDDADPAFWKPSRDELLAFQKADLVVINGAEFEKWVAQASLPARSLVVTAKPFEKDFFVIEKAITHSHGKEGPHSHQGVDGHTWLDPINAKAQAGEILKALKARRPDDEAALQQRFDALAKDLDALDAAFKALPKQPDGQWLLASHPAYNYVARRYGLRVFSLPLDPDEMPSDEQLAAIAEQTKQTPAKVLIWEAEPKPEIAAKIRERCALASLVVSPCEMLSAEQKQAGLDYVGVMKRNVEVFRNALGGAPK